MIAPSSFHWVPPYLNNVATSSQGSWRMRHLVTIFPTKGSVTDRERKNGYQEFAGFLGYHVIKSKEEGQETVIYSDRKIILWIFTKKNFQIIFHPGILFLSGLPWKPNNLTDNTGFASSGQAYPCR